MTQRGSWKPWILYMLDAIEKTAELTSQLIISILKQMEATLEYARPQIKWYNKEVNELIFSQPYIKPKLLGDTLGISSRTTLTKYFNELVENKILSPKKDGKEVFYINDDLTFYVKTGDYIAYLASFGSVFFGILILVRRRKFTEGVN